MVIWPWPWIFKIKFWKCCISGMGGPIDMERKGCDLWVDRMLHPLVTFNFYLLKPWPWSWIFKLKFWKKSYLRNGMAHWHGMKGMWVDRMLDPCCDFQLSPHPWPWPWIFKFKFWKIYISRIGWVIDMERKECESIECWTHVLTFNVHLTHDLDLRFSRSNLEIAVSQEWDGWFTWNQRDVSR